jgi:hypothetical protein
MDVSVCGDVIVTDFAIIVVAPDPNKASAVRMGARAAGGAAGSLAMDGRLGSGGSGSLLNLDNAEPIPPLASLTRLATCWPSEVPQELSGRSDWPRIAESRPLTFYPRNVVGKVRLSFTGELTLTLPGVGPDVRAGVNFWQVGKAKGALRRAGFPLE